MELRVLKYFIAIAREENMTRAADILHVTQPTLSKQIKDLEDELGKKLFNRSNYSIKLTTEGEVLYKRALDIVGLANETINELKEMEEVSGGRVNIGAAESDLVKYFVRIIKQLHSECPGIQVSIYSGDSESVTYKLDKGQLDFAIVVRSFDFAKYNSIKLPFSDKWGLIVRRDNPLALKKQITIDDIEKEPLIVSRQSLSYDIHRWCGEKADKLNVVATGDIPFNLSLFVKEGMGSFLCFDKIVNTDELSDLMFIPLSPVLESPIYLIWKKNSDFTPAARKLKERFCYLQGKLKNQ